jgi:hypothetical protein
MIDSRTGYPIVKEERSHWRDEEISERHKLWGFNCPAIDLDFVMTEFDTYMPIAFFEYKKEPCSSIIINKCPEFKVLINLGNMCHLPSYFCKYRKTEDSFEFSIMALNRIAIDMTPKDKTGVWLLEKQFVDFLYWLRKRDTPSGLFDCNNKLITL